MPSDRKTRSLPKMSHLSNLPRLKDSEAAIKENLQFSSSLGCWKFLAPPSSTSKASIAVTYKNVGSPKSKSKSRPTTSHVHTLLREPFLDVPHDIPEIPSETEEEDSDEFWDTGGPSTFPSPLIPPQAAETHQLDSRYLKVVVNFGRNHEVWDPKRHDIYTIYGQIFYKPWKYWPHLSTPPQIVSLSTQLYIKPQHGPAGPKGPDELIGDATASLMTATLSSKPAIFNTQTLHPTRTTKHNALLLSPSISPPSASRLPPALPTDQSKSKTKFKSVSLLPPPPRIPTPEPSFEITPLLFETDGRSTRFRVDIPVGGPLFESKGSGNVTRRFRLKITAEAQMLSCGKLLGAYECVLDNFEFCLSVLRAREIMYGQKAEIKLTEEEKRMREVLGIYGF
ncbi:hypothetical protein M422DRAFT_37186 [Sphaerobolus stellatus SS14]|uniref:Uncharacterized protein n=1 Tax=Sphaerobolus stellatus (strain SS14) TaxID=990650 RepID=A0A0C9UJ53_SPHS4|nr:hypothetical protein M422DRAFT_37186 [Sphaerobolus stellatus SS14]